MAKSKLKGLNNKGTDAEEEVVDPLEESGFGKRLSKLRDRFKLGPHHKMERFSILLGGTLSFMLIFTAVSFAGHQSKLATQASVQSVFTESFTYSQTQQPGTVVGVYGDEDRRDVMVLFQMADPSGMSADASNYEVFLTGEKNPLEMEPDVTFALFGSTGYGMVRFESDTRINNEVVNVILRSKSTLTENKDPIDEEALPDESFLDHDQAQIYVNPGADEINIVKDLAPGEDDPATLYAALVAETKDAEIRERIEETTSTIATSVNKANEYTNRLSSSGYKPPAAPWFIEGDYVDDEGVYRPGKYLLAAHKLDYATSSIREGYIKQVADGLTGYAAYAEAHADKISKAATDDKTPSEDVTAVTTLEREDGSVLDLATVTTGASPTEQVAAKDSVDALMTTWQNHVSSKRTLQTELMLELLVLDADVLSQPALYSEASGEKTVFYY